MNWKTAYLESRVASAGPVELISILYEYAIISVQDARAALETGDVPARVRAISKVVAILSELDCSLDRTRGGEIASNLARLYRYMRERLVLPATQKSDSALAEIEGLLRTLGEAWDAIAKRHATEANQTERGENTGSIWAPALASTSEGAHGWSV